ncbi:MAG: 4-(cytidine 5'-diphospho)-2-C-methyl-D-erythritol kinase [Synechococcaceae cyanobacterium]|nr:4-(cytidine 5'-diphospho)-2-C-methyl-D-erythritol kinase [Synechococcaceae cyanobacterium]
MAEVCVIAPAKINLHLEVLGLRPDGYHELAMVMQSLDLADRLRLENTADASIHLRCDRDDLPLGPDNLIVMAAQRLRDSAGLPELGASVTLEKRIPIGAGLAGGSSDAAATLVGLNELWGLGLPPSALHTLAAELGSDVPYCLEGGTQLCFGRGERLEAVPDPRRPLAVLLLKDPQSSVSTPWAYGRCRELRADFYLTRESEFAERRQALRDGPLLKALRGEGSLPPLRNDLQSVVVDEVPSVAAGLALLRRAEGALAVAMSGSGPSLFALFADLHAARAAEAALAADLAAAGLQSWCCRCTGSGASLENAEPVR